MNQRPQAGWWRPDLANSNAVRSDRDDNTHGATNALAVTKNETARDLFAFRALMGFTFILLIAPQTYWPALAPLRIALLAGGLAVLAHLVSWVRHNETVLGFPEMKIIAGIVGWAIITAPFSLWFGGSISTLLNMYLKSVAVFWLLGTVINSSVRMRQIIWGLTLMSIPLAIVGVKHYLSGGFMREGVGTRIIGYEAPLTGNPNDLALMLNLILPLTLALMSLSRKPTIRMMLMGIVLLNVMAIMLTFSRGGFLTLMSVSLIYLWRSKGQPARKWALGGLIVGLCCLPLLPSAYLDRLTTIWYVEEDETGSARSRRDVMIDSMKLVLQNPIIGSGMGQNVLALNQVRGTTWKHVHNVYLEYAVELGVPGLALFLLLFKKCVKSAKVVREQCARLPKAYDLFCLATGLEISLLSFALAAFFHPVAYHFYFYYIAGLSIALRTICKQMRLEPGVSGHPSAAHIAVEALTA